MWLKCKLQCLIHDTHVKRKNVKQIWFSRSDSNEIRTLLTLSLSIEKEQIVKEGFYWFDLENMQTHTNIKYKYPSAKTQIAGRQWQSEWTIGSGGLVWSEQELLSVFLGVVGWVPSPTFCPPTNTHSQHTYHHRDRGDDGKDNDGTFCE